MLTTSGPKIGGDDLRKFSRSEEGGKRHRWGKNFSCGNENPHGGKIYARGENITGKKGGLFNPELGRFEEEEN